MPDAAVSSRPTGCAQYLTQELSTALKRRSDISDKWERNREAFQGKTLNHWKTDPDGAAWRSKTFPNATRQKVLTGVAIIIDQFLQAGRFPFMLVPAGEGEREIDALPPERRLELDDIRKDMERQIRQWLDDCDADVAFMRNIFAAGMMGETYAKRIVMERVEKQYRPVQTAGITDFVGEQPPYERVAVKTMQPAWQYCANETMVRDLEAQELRDGYVYHVVPYSPRQLKQWAKGNPFAIPSAVETALSKAKRKGTGAGSTASDPSTLLPHERDLKERKRNIRFAERWGYLPLKTVEQFEADVAMMAGGQQPSVATDIQDQATDADEVFVLLWLADDEMVGWHRVSPNEMPFSRAVWQEALDEAAGIGISDNCEQMQYVIVGAMRAIEDNAKLAGNVMGIKKSRFLLDRLTTMTPGVWWEASEDCEDARQAIQQLKIDPQIEPLLRVLELAVQFLEEDSMIPRISQGIQTDDKETAYSVSVRVEKSGKYLGMVIKNFDELVEDQLDWFVQYCMDDPDAKTRKAPFKVKALGFSSFQARRERIEKLERFLAIITQVPELSRRYDLGKLVDAIAKALDMEPEEFERSQAELDAEAEAGAPMQQLEQEALAAKADKDRAAAEAARSGADAKLAQVELEAEREERQPDMDQQAMMGRRMQMRRMLPAGREK